MFMEMRMTSPEVRVVPADCMHPSILLHQPPPLPEHPKPSRSESTSRKCGVQHPVIGGAGRNRLALEASEFEVGGIRRDEGMDERVEGSGGGGGWKRGRIRHHRHSGFSAPHSKFSGAYNPVISSVT